MGVLCTVQWEFSAPLKTGSLHYALKRVICTTYVHTANRLSHIMPTSDKLVHMQLVIRLLQSKETLATLSHCYRARAVIFYNKQELTLKSLGM